ncbi:MAG: type 4a pilus biogenesis protein PilO [Bacteriovoracaceae bacterium]|nr:type 4a pilus biogenesis protein PilO [Bacteriovoracaceae bacterium]
MKEMLSKFLAKLHVILFAYAAYGFYEVYSEHETLLEEINAQIPAVQTDIATAQKKLSQIDEFRKNVDQTKLRVTEVFNSIEKVQKQLPAEINDIEILDFISKEGRGLNMPEIEPNPLREQPMGFYISKPYQIRARGTFLQFVIFLERINSADRLFNVQNLTIRSDTQPQKGRFQVVSMDTTIDTFKFNSSHKESSGLEEIETQFGGGGAAADDGSKPKRKKRRGGGE